uniref:NADH-ubiquinone oxidoreductase chain 4L n=1 Tax=Ophiuroglypha kinbergi TaxID=3253740 RepID=A0A7G9M4T5_9ECHI|nr:NADH dehydrogenase subunit 4L [Ophiura kinbergi]QNN00522.1 NADH dehydrogenase subunit 4L [Ophiura kinbergi]
MSIFPFITIFSSIIAFISIIYNKNFLLSILIALELLLLNLLIVNIFISNNLTNSISLSFSLFLLTLSAIEASIGISILALISRNFNTNSINSINLLKN